ncbi:hypothetical protein [Phormidesmis priestleyi]
MRNLKRVLCGVLLMATIVPSLPALTLPTTATPVIARPQLSWSDIFKWLGGEPRDSGSGGVGGRRGGQCLITPGENTTIWNTRPTFVWQGTIDTIGLRKADTTSELLPRSKPSKISQSKRSFYIRKPLQAGQTYDWLFFDKAADKEPQFWVKFQVMKESDRAPITADLRTLETTLKRQKAKKETIALQRARHFAKHKLWSDVLQEVYSVKNPSSELKGMAEKASEKLCTQSANKV